MPKVPLLAPHPPTMSDPDIHKLKAEGWGNCPKCGYFFKQRVLEHCPMCRHEWKRPVAYQQPEYESPGL